MFLLVLTSSASTCLQHSPNRVPTIISPSVDFWVAGGNNRHPGRNRWAALRCPLARSAVAVFYDLRVRWGEEGGERGASRDVRSEGEREGGGTGGTPLAFWQFKCKFIISAREGRCCLPLRSRSVAVQATGGLLSQAQAHGLN